MNARPLPFTAPWLLAPMEGVTDPAFRSLVLRLNRPEDLGGAFTEFLRVLERPHSARVLRRHVGPHVGVVPVGVQLMGGDPQVLARTASNVPGTGAALVDLNFGCPAKGALRGCAGSSLLRDPRSLEELVRTCAEALEGRLWLSAKIRAGYDDDRLLEELACAVEAGGADLLTVHCRTRAEGYQEEVDWSRIARAVDSVELPVCGNGGVTCHADLERMRRATGCRFVMIGRAALGDPWIFAGRSVSASEAARFLLAYARAMQDGGASPSGALARTKQLLRHWTAGGLVADEEQRSAWMRLREPQALWTALARRGATRPPSPSGTGPGADLGPRAA